MSGPQFMHLQSYSRKPNARGQSVDQIFDEAARVPVYSKHVDDPQPPKLIFGASVDGVRKLHGEMVARGGVEVALKDGVAAKRGVRKDRHTLMTVIASHPLPTELVQSDATARADYEHWREHNLAWLKAHFGKKLVSVIEHWDEKHPHIHAYILPLDDPTCSARQLNPAWQAKEKAMEIARVAGHDDRVALKFGNAAYRVEARELQDDYYQQVSLPCGLTRTGPKRRRLSRQQWKAEKDAARRESDLLRQMEDRMEALADAQAQLDVQVEEKAAEIASKIELAENLLADAEVARAEAEKLAVGILQQAQVRADGLTQRIREGLDARESAIAIEFDRVKVASASLEVERENLHRKAFHEAVNVTVRAFLGVLTGTVSLSSDRQNLRITDEPLSRDVNRLQLGQLLRAVVIVVESVWQRLTSRLSQPERQTEQQRAVNELRPLGQKPSQGFEP